MRFLPHLLFVLGGVLVVASVMFYLAAIAMAISAGSIVEVL